MIALYIRGERAEDAAKLYRMLGDEHSAHSRFAYIARDATTHSLGIKAFTKMGGEREAQCFIDALGDAARALCEGIDAISMNTQTVNAMVFCRVRHRVSVAVPINA